jgi:Zn-dependent peptidase ImmA (M78 family)/transcriptional regulator with XRE-family HTH domain
VDAIPHSILDSRSLGQRLQQARRARSLTQEQVAAHLKVARTTITAIEKGERRIQPSELVELAGLFGRPVGDFLRPVQTSEPFIVQLRAVLAPDTDTDSAIEPSSLELQELSENYRQLEEMCGAPMPRHYPEEYRYGAGLSPEIFGEDMAVKERLRLSLGDGPVPNLREMLENEVGLRIFFLPMPSRIAAMFAYGDELGGCIAINSSHPAERQRMSLAHDYAHFLVSRRQSEVTILRRHVRYPGHERLADAFARAFLMPASGLRRRAIEAKLSRGGALTPADLCILADLYFVSVEAMTRRLEELEILPMGTWERLRQKRFQPREAQELLGIDRTQESDAELPIRYRLLAVEAFERGELSEGTLARFLRVDRLEARTMVQELTTDSMVSDQGENGVLALDLGGILPVKRSSENQS